jgi:para-aminobenzoate synthetase / 4-amino-4-deoxychorismate lyase
MKIEAIIEKVLQNKNSAFFYTPAYYKKSFSFLFTNPGECFQFNSENFDELFKLEKMLNNQSFYSTINYEAGYLFEKGLQPLIKNNKNNLIKIFLFDEKNIERYKSSSIKIKPFNNNFSVDNFHLNTSYEDFESSIEQIKNYISEGDTYQVNYTVKGKFKFSGDLINLFKALIFSQSARYTALINDDDEIIVSLSPELFFKLEKRKIISKPMKGTGKRGLNFQSDILNEHSLKNSSKNKAENLMIVDLIRNDIGKISEAGKVKVPSLFDVEKYESLFQMTSTVEGKPAEGFSLFDIIKNLFPCGSITGAPKIKTMEIISKLEKEERGIYTGAIGFSHKEKTLFNVPIRTLTINKKSLTGEIGLGSGIVWESLPQDEYNETLLKSNFLTSPQKYFELFETILFEEGNYFLLEEHIERLERSAGHFLFIFDAKKFRNHLSKLAAKLISGKKYKIKVVLNKLGKINSVIEEISPLNEEIKVIISPNTVTSKNRFQYFKTTNRELYDEEYKAYSSEGYFDVIYVNEKNQIAEGAITNIYIKRNGMLYTPPLESGILPGVYRKYFLRKNINIKEEPVYKDDMLAADEIILTNSVRKQVKVNKLYFSPNEYKIFQ